MVHPTSDPTSESWVACSNPGVRTHVFFKIFMFIKSCLKTLSYMIFRQFVVKHAVVYLELHRCSIGSRFC